MITLQKLKWYCWWTYKLWGKNKKQNQNNPEQNPAYLFDEKVTEWNLLFYMTTVAAYRDQNPIEDAKKLSPKQSAWFLFSPVLGLLAVRRSKHFRGALYAVCLKNILATIFHCFFTAAIRQQHKKYIYIYLSRVTLTFTVPHNSSKWADSIHRKYTEIHSKLFFFTGNLFPSLLVVF